MNTCLPTHVSVDPSLQPLIERYCGCPNAAAYVSSGRLHPKLDNIFASPKSTAHMAFYSDDHRDIYIPQSNIYKDEGLTALVVELFNAQSFSPERMEVDRQAALGCIGMDTYAHKYEEWEANATKERISLYEKCKTIWGNTLLEEGAKDPILKAFDLEVTGHTNFYRNFWIKNFQLPYCLKHPKNQRSCQTKVGDLIDVMEINQMTLDAQNKLFIDRLCQLYPCAPKPVQRNPFYLKIFAAYCDIEALVKKQCLPNVVEIDASCSEPKPEL